MKRQENTLALTLALPDPALPMPPPRAQPFPSLAALLAWSPGERPHDAACRGTLRLEEPVRESCVRVGVVVVGVGVQQSAQRPSDKPNPSQPPPPTQPRVYVCHDLAGGYADDAAACGCRPRDPSPFLFLHWHCMDTFIYFSHAPVALPPPGWIDAAHAAGVACLGTLIFERGEGAAAAAAATASPAAADAVAAALARAAAYYGFDGWLLNVEVEVPVEHVENLVRLVARTRAAIRTAVPGGRGEVVWYDAVTRHGRLAWQNAWTAANEAYAVAADALWLNYGWRPRTLAASVAAARAANHPASAVIAGWDAWGRGTYGGGGVAGAAVAAAAAAAAGASLGVFAPGWAWEGEGAAGAAARADALWAGVTAAYAATRCPRAHRPPFHSAFFGGVAGDVWRVGGRAHATTPWLHIGAAHAAPLFQTHVSVSVALVVVTAAAGTCVRVALSSCEAAVVASGPHGAIPTGAHWPPTTPHRGGAALAVRGSVHGAAPLPDTPLFRVAATDAAPLTARAAVRGDIRLALIGDDDGAETELTPCHVDAAGWTVLQATVAPSSRDHTLALRWPHARGPFAASVGEVAVTPTDWAPGLPSPVAGAVTATAEGGGCARVEWEGRAGNAVARWSVCVCHPPRWVADAVASHTHVTNVQPGDTVVVVAQFQDGSVESEAGAAHTVV